MNCVDFACKELGIEKELIWSAKKTKDILAKRWMIICFLYELGFNYMQIARKLMKNHQTIMHAVKCADVNAWYIGRELAIRYEAFTRVKKIVPNYGKSRMEEKFV